ncbi:MAG: hypothetical protein HY074_05295 [Deltaproteobacteria bacterium]|nr:hypothetical protein [Deltaproteobacteria bacterium]
MKTLAVSTTLLIGFAVMISGCNEHAPLRENTNAQNAVLTQSKLQELAPAEGSFAGRMLMKVPQGKEKEAKFLPYDCTITISHSIQNMRTSTSPTETVDVPILKATLNFDIFEGLSNDQFEAVIDQYREITYPMGLNRYITTDVGNYNPASRTVNFPYTVGGDTLGTTFGDISGKLSEDGQHLTGYWKVPRLKMTAAFDLVKQK